MFRDFLGSLHRFWLEMMGILFLALAVIFASTAIQAYQKYGTSEYSLATLIFAIFLSGLTLSFSLHSFWKSRKIR